MFIYNIRYKCQSSYHDSSEQLDLP